MEYSIQEARARFMGLLGKKWAPLPPKNSRKSLFYGGGAEPTVTINTKEALADVFGMYNSPDKTRSIGIPGSKHAPLKKIEPITPIAQPRFTSPTENSNSENLNRNRSENDPLQISKTPTASKFRISPAFLSGREASFIITNAFHSIPTLCRRKCKIQLGHPCFKQGIALWHSSIIPSQPCLSSRHS